MGIPVSYFKFVPMPSNQRPLFESLAAWRMAVSAQFVHCVLSRRIMNDSCYLPRVCMHVSE